MNGLTSAPQSDHSWPCTSVVPYAVSAWEKNKWQLKYDHKVRQRLCAKTKYHIVRANRTNRGSESIPIYEQHRVSSGKVTRVPSVGGKKKIFAASLQVKVLAENMSNPGYEFSGSTVSFTVRLIRN